MSDAKIKVVLAQFDQCPSSSTPQLVCKQLGKRFTGAVEFCVTPADELNSYFVVAQFPTRPNQEMLYRMRDTVATCVIAISILNGDDNIKITQHNQGDQNV